MRDLHEMKWLTAKIEVCYDSQSLHEALNSGTSNACEMLATRVKCRMNDRHIMCCLPRVIVLPRNRRKQQEESGDQGSVTIHVEYKRRTIEFSAPYTFYLFG